MTSWAEATPPTPTIGSAGSAACTSHTALTATGWMAGPDSPPLPLPSTGRARSMSSAIPGRVFTRVTASAPPLRAASAISTRFVTAAVSFAHRGRLHAAVTAIVSAVAAADWANMPLPFTFGHDRLTSTATTAFGAAASSSAART